MTNRLTLGPLTAWAVLSALTLAGCADLDGASHLRNPRYDWGMVNGSSHDLTHDTRATCVIGGQTYKVNGGAESRGMQRFVELGLDPIPDVVHVHCEYQQDLAGPRPHPPAPAPQDFDVAVHGHIPDEAHFSGTLWLVVRDDGVTLYPETEADQRRRGPDLLAATTRP